MSLATDLRFVARSLARNPAFVATEVLSLALTGKVRSSMRSAMVNIAVFAPMPSAGARPQPISRCAE